MGDRRNFLLHILKVYYSMNVFWIPESQISKKWRSANEGFQRVNDGVHPQPKFPYILFVNSLVQVIYELTGCAVENESVCNLITKKMDALTENVISNWNLRWGKHTERTILGLISRSRCYSWKALFVCMKETSSPMSF